MWVNAVASDEPTARFGASIAYCSSSYQCILFGGTNGRSMFNDVHLLKPFSKEEVVEEISVCEKEMREAMSNSQMQDSVLKVGNEISRLRKLVDTNTSAPMFRWKNLSCSGDVPVPRLGATLCVVDETVYLYGGYDGSSVYGDLYTLDIGSGAWKLQRVDRRRVGLVPPARYLHSCCVFGTNIVIFGGQNTQTVMSDLWVFDTTMNDWIEIDCPSSPRPRCAHAAAVINRVLYIFGGSSGPKALSDIWSLDLALPNPTWEPIETNGDTPPTICEHSCAVVGVDVVFHGGNMHSSRTGGTFVFSADTYQWRDISDTFGGTMSVPRSLHSLGYLEHLGLLVTFGGYDGKSALKSFACVKIRDHLMQIGRGRKVDIPVFESEEGSDVTFIVSGKSLFANRAVLISRSRFFREFFTSNPSSDVVEVGSTREVIIRKILEYIYTDTTSIPPSDALEIMEVALSFQLSELADQAAEIVRLILDVDNVIDVFVVSDTHNIEFLKEAAADFAAMHFDEIANTNSFRSLPEETRTLFEERRPIQAAPITAAEETEEEKKPPFSFLEPLAPASVSEAPVFGDVGSLDFTQFAPEGSVVRGEDQAAPMALEDSLIHEKGPNPVYYSMEELERLLGMGKESPKKEKSISHKYSKYTHSVKEEKEEMERSPVRKKEVKFVDDETFDPSLSLRIEDMDPMNYHPEVHEEMERGSPLTREAMNQFEKEMEDLHSKQSLEASMASESVQMGRKRLYMEHLEGKTRLMRDLNKEREVLLKENSMLRQYLRGGLRSLPPWVEATLDLKRQCDAVEAENQRLEQEVGNVRRKHASLVMKKTESLGDIKRKQDSFLSAMFDEKSLVLSPVAAEATIDAPLSEDVKEVVSLWLKELRLLRESFKDDKRVAVHERNALDGEFAKRRSLIEKEYEERILQAKGRVDHLRYTENSLESESHRLRRNKELAEEKECDEVTTTHACHRAHNELRDRVIVHQVNRKQIYGIIDNFKMETVELQERAALLKSELETLKANRAREQTQYAELEKSLSSVVSDRPYY